MALTTAAEMQLQDAGFITGFEAERPIWLDMAQEAYTYTSGTIVGAPKHDDVAPHLELALEASKEYAALKKKLSAIAKYWNRRFADLIVNRVWLELTKEIDDGDQDNQAQPG